MKSNRIVLGSLILALAVLSSAPTYACDCLLSKNWSNPACKGKTPKLPSGARITNTLSQGQTQTQGQGQSQAITNSGNSTNANSSRSNSTSGSTATGGSVGPVQSVSTATVGNVSAAGGQGGSSTSTASGGQGGSAQGGASSSDSNSGGNSYSSYTAASRTPVNTAIAGIGITTAGCRFAEGLGVQTMPAGTSVGFSFKDHDCARFELAQYFYSRGQNEAGDRLVCQIKEVSDALGKGCLTIVALAPVPAVAADAVTHAELQQVEKRMLIKAVSK